MEAIHYTIRPADPDAHLFEVTLRIDDPDPAGQRLALPVWIPGSYMVREFARHLEGLEARLVARRGREPRATGRSRPAVGSRRVTVVKTDKNSWTCAAIPAGGGFSLELSYRVYAWDLSVRTAHLDASHGFFNGTSVFLAVRGREAEPCSVDILAPAGSRFRNWRVATTLPRAGGEHGAELYGFGRYHAADYDELIDHPVELGTFALAGFSVGGCRHEIAVTGRIDADLRRLVRDLKPVCAAQIALFEPQARRAPMSRYLFLTMAVGDGYGGLEHRASTALLCSRNALPWPGMAGVNDGYRTFLGLASHEYFHTWHVKRIKPARFEPYDLDRENYTRLLWIFEGFTSYYDDLMLCRTGAIDAVTYLQGLQRSIRSVLAGPGHRQQSVAESSFDAWIKYYRQDENSPNAIVSYYVKGSLVALCLDTTIRARTRSRRSLDDVMRLLWQRYGKPRRRPAADARGGDSTGAPGDTGGRGLAEDEFPDLVAEATGVDLAAEIARWAYGTGELPIAKCLQPFGITVGRAPAETLGWLGARTADRNGELVVQNAYRDGPAARGGLSAGDRLIAIDGLRCNEALLQLVLARRKPGSVLRVHAFRRDELIETEVTLAAAPPLVTLAAHGRNPTRDAWLGAAG
ncbi:MAG: M61 family metallopeptidase [Lautropia sp.]